MAMYSIRRLDIDGQEPRLFISLGPIQHFRRIKRLLLKRFGAKGTWRNIWAFYLGLFDDFYREYIISAQRIIIEPEGFTRMDGLTLHSEATNQLMMDEICAALNEAFNNKTR